ncbi:glyoxalase/bleomycin resistance/dioxygenase family protein [soil metagenome]
MKKIIGLGGVFFKSKDPKALAEWYQKHLGFDFNETTYTDFPLSGKGFNVLSFFPEDTKYLAPSESSFMLNFRVEDLDALLQVLHEEGITVFDEIEDGEFGKFGWILDLEGNKIELWQPPD